MFSIVRTLNIDNMFLFQIFSYISSENIDFNERGFIHFPDAKHKEIDKLDMGICLVRSCGRSFDSNILKCHVSKTTVDVLVNNFLISH